MMGFDADQIIEDVAGAKTAASRFAVLTNALSAIGLETVNYGVFGPNADDLIEKEVQFLTTMRGEWMDYYYDKNLSSTDTHVLRARSGKITSYVWGESAYGRLETQQYETARLVAEAGMRSALCVPVTGPSGGFAPVGAINLGSGMPERDFRMIIREHGSELINLSHLFHAATIRQVWREQIGVEPLSARERDCLRHLAAGRRLEAVAHALGLAKITVEVHVSNARRKMAARTTTEAVAKALLLGEIPHG